MKKVFFAVLFAGVVAVSAQAQMFVGGTLGLDYTARSSSYDGTKTKYPSGFFIEFSPMLGFQISEKFAIGTEASLGIGALSDRKDKPQTALLVGWGVAPFARITLVNAGDLSLLLHSSVGVSGMTEKSSYDGTTEDGDTFFNFGVGVLPVLSYGLTEKLSIEARTNFLRLGFGIASRKGPGDKPTKVSDTYFGLGVNSTGPQEIIDAYGLGMTAMNAPLLELGLVFKF